MVPNGRKSHRRRASTATTAQRKPVAHRAAFWRIGNALSFALFGTFAPTGQQTRCMIGTNGCVAATAHHQKGWLHRGPHHNDVQNLANMGWIQALNYIVSGHRIYQRGKARRVFGDMQRGVRSETPYCTLVVIGAPHTHFHLYGRIQTNAWAFRCPCRGCSKTGG